VNCRLLGPLQTIIIIIIIIIIIFMPSVANVPEGLKYQNMDLYSQR